MEATLTFKSLTNYQEGTSAKGPWKKQEAVFETRDNYPKMIAVSAFNGWAEALAKCQPGAVYDIKFDIESREWNGKWYTDINLFSIAVHATMPTAQQSQPAPAPALPIEQQPGIEETDDLPF